MDASLFFWSGGWGATNPPINEVGLPHVFEAASGGEQGVGARFRPAAARRFEPAADDALAGIVHDAGSDRQSALPIEVVAHSVLVGIAVADNGRDGFGPAAAQLQGAAMIRATRPVSSCSLIRSIHAFRSPLYRVTACNAAAAYSRAWNWSRVKVLLRPSKISSQVDGNHQCAASTKPDTRLRLIRCPKLNKEKPVSHSSVNARNCSIIGTQSADAERQAECGAAAANLLTVCRPVGP